MAADLEQELSTSLGRTGEILSDLQHVLAEHGPGSEQWRALWKELKEQEERTADLGHQLDARLDQRLECDPQMARLTARGDQVINSVMTFEEDL